MLVDQTSSLPPKLISEVFILIVLGVALLALGGNYLGTPAVSSPTSGHVAASSSSEAPTMFANHGGEALLVQPHVHATGYHQDECAVGLRSIIVNTRQTNFHFIVVYFDCTVSLDGGSDIEKCNKSFRKSIST